jgi:cell division protein FtsB
VLPSPEMKLSPNVRIWTLLILGLGGFAWFITHDMLKTIRRQEQIETEQRKAEQLRAKEKQEALWN